MTLYDILNTVVSMAYYNHVKCYQSFIVIEKSKYGPNVCQYNNT